MFIGSHLSISRGYEQAGKEALRIGANTFQYFTRNPRGGRARKLDQTDMDKLRALMEENRFGPLLGHAPYTLNPASDKETVRAFAEIAMREDLARMDLLPGNYYNFHPGSHVGQGVEKGLDYIIGLLNLVLPAVQGTKVLLETMAGKGTEIGGNFEEIAAILQQVNQPEKMGVCLDTCHIHEAGYDIVKDLDGVLDAFDRIIGLDKLFAIHLNDSKNPKGAKKDRHEKIGEGTLGLSTIEKIINHEKMQSLPFYLETPNEPEGYAEEIALLRGLRNTLQTDK
ncbi:MAG: deoxyribonuclease IV [Tissierellia bacterium]|nr:deoxyribonuclease IV [Bacillota bacterium]NLK59050.1 deoxyribonuclease IV [Tissierellia bacterium]